jgi:hypothetical protein
MYNAKVYRPQGGDKLVVDDGGQIEIKEGGKITAAGTQAEAIADLEATAELEDVIDTVNDILAALRAIGIIAPDAEE